MEQQRRELTWEQVEEWVRAHGYLDGGKTNWSKMLKDSGVGTDQYNLKKRWREGSATRNRELIRDHLDELEKKKPTDIGAKIEVRGVGTRPDTAGRVVSAKGYRCFRVGRAGRETRGGKPAQVRRAPRGHSQDRRRPGDHRPVRLAAPIWGTPK